MTDLPTNIETADPAELLAALAARDTARTSEHEALCEAAEESGDYSYRDERGADLNEQASDDLSIALDLLRRVLSTQPAPPVALFRRECFACEELVPADAEVCPHCKSDTDLSEARLYCPHDQCADVDNIAEVDRAERWNRLTTRSVQPDGHADLHASLAPAEFESTGDHLCLSCGKPVSLPESVEVTDWS